MYFIIVILIVTFVGLLVLDLLSDPARRRTLKKQTMRESKRTSKQTGAKQNV